jgi:hypothetical protein
VKCSHCGQILSSKDFDSHKCDLKLKESRIIEVVYFRDDSFDDKKFMAGWGVDGVLYSFKVVPRKAISYFTSLPDKSKHLPESIIEINPKATRRKFTGKETRQRLDRTLSTDI